MTSMKKIMLTLLLVSLMACKKVEPISERYPEPDPLIGKIYIYAVGLPTDSFRYKFSSTDGTTPAQYRAGLVSYSPFQIKLGKNKTLNIYYKTISGVDTFNSYLTGDTITILSDSLPATVYSN